MSVLAVFGETVFHTRAMSTCLELQITWRARMGNEDLTNCIPWYNKPHFKCEDIQDGKTQRRMRRKNQLRKRKGRL